jgi:IPT/TIG domain
MLRLRSIILGSLVVWQIGCGGSTPLPSTPPNTPPKTPSPNISISPATAAVGSPDFTLTITGLQQFSFTSGTHKFNEAVWSANGSDTPLATTFVSSSQITAIVPSALLTSPVEAKVHVEIWDRQGDAPEAISSSVPFSVTIPSTGTLSITSISPSTVAAGSPDVTIAITGSNFDHQFLHTSVAFWSTDPNNLHEHGIMLVTTFVNGNQLTALIPAALLEQPVSVQVLVLTGDVGRVLRLPEVEPCHFYCHSVAQEE